MTISQSLRKKLDPRRFPRMSGQMAAIVGCILGEEFTVDRIAHLYVTSDGFLLAETVGDVGANHFLGRASDLDRNWQELLNVAGLTDEERIEAKILFKAAVTRS